MTGVWILQRSRDGIKISLKGLKEDTPENLNQLYMAARNAFQICVLDVRKDSYFLCRGPTVASKVALTAIKSRIIEGGATLSLQDFKLFAITP